MAPSVAKRPTGSVGKHHAVDVIARGSKCSQPQTSGSVTAKPSSVPHASSMCASQRSRLRRKMKRCAAMSRPRRSQHARQLARVPRGAQQRAPVERRRPPLPERRDLIRRGEARDQRRAAVAGERGVEVGESTGAGVDRGDQDGSSPAPRRVPDADRGPPRPSCCDSASDQHASVDHAARRTCARSPTRRDSGRWRDRASNRAAGKSPCRRRGCLRPAVRRGAGTGCRWRRRGRRVGETRRWSGRRQ